MQRVMILLALFIGNCWVVLSQDFSLPPGYDGTVHPFNLSEHVEVAPTVYLKSISFTNGSVFNSVNARVKWELRWSDRRFPSGYFKEFTGQDAATFVQRIWKPAYEFSNFSSSDEVNETMVAVRSSGVTWSRTSNMFFLCREALDAIQHRTVDGFKCELEFMSRGNWGSGSTTYAPGEYAFYNSTTTTPDSTYRLASISSVRRLGVLYYYMTFFREGYTA